MEQEVDLITGQPLQNDQSTVNVSDDRTRAWVEKYRGVNLDEIVLPEKLDNTIRNAIKLGGYNNYIFHSGSPGTGKTSLAMAFPLMLGAEREVIYARRDSEILQSIEEGGMYRSGNGLPKYYVIDEADNPSNPDSFYTKLQSLIEATSSNLRFILTCNSIWQIREAIRSRCTPISFDHSEDDVEYRRRIYKRLRYIAKTETDISKGTWSKDTLAETISACYPDIRAMINAMHLTFLENGGSIVGHPNVIREQTIADIYRLTIAMDFRKLQYYLSTHVRDYRSVYVPFGVYFQKRIPLPTTGQIDYLSISFASLLGKALRATQSQVNQMVTLEEFLADVQLLLAQYQMVGKMPLEEVAVPKAVS